MKKILLVDDEPDILNILEFEFQDIGYKTELAGSGNEAIHKLRAGKSFDAIISDIRMPDGTGIDLLENKTLPLRPPVFFLTGFADITKEEAQALGAADMFYKPFKFEEIIQKVQGHLDNSSLSC